MDEPLVMPGLDECELAGALYATVLIHGCMKPIEAVEILHTLGVQVGEDRVKAILARLARENRLIRIEGKGYCPP